jgi:hypothetical protein
MDSGMSTYARRRPAVTAGDAVANEALRLLGKVDLARVSTPGLFVNDMLAIARRLYDEAQGRRPAE